MAEIKQRMILSEIILKSKYRFNVVGDTNVEIASIEIDSRKAGKNSLFIAQQGTVADSHMYIDNCIQNGAVAIVCETLPSVLSAGICYLQTDNSRNATGFLATAFYGNPSESLELVGITGTNGKTSVATMLFQLFSELGYLCGLISTVENKIGTNTIPSTHTTPDPIALNQLLLQMVNAGCRYCFMEVSSHAAHQGRINGLRFAGGLFTNITHDHLDYHITFDNYLDAKKSFFDRLDASSFALTNKDDKCGMVMLQNCKASKYTYGIRTAADFKVKILENDFNGMLLRIGEQEAWFQIVGEFNAYNLASVYGAAFLLGVKEDILVPALSKLKRVSGRFETIRSEKNVYGIVDYAHTPDALKNVLDTIKQIRTGNETLITVIGCGGNRDKAKRPLMAKIASELSDRVILTSDNPRDEDPENILDEMEAGIPGELYKKTLRITDRKSAIKTAVAMASKGDIILVAGKGHEKYQEVKGVKHPFDDKQVLKLNMEESA